MNSIFQDVSIKIYPADKGNATVIMNTEDYKSKVLEHLSDPNYHRINGDPTKALETTINNKLLNLKKQKRLDKSLYTHLKASNSSCPVFYGLPKIHKPEIPIRPICDYRKSPVYKLGFYLNKIFKSMTQKSNFSLHNTYQFASEIKNYQIPDGYTMTSFDVVSLFTKVPLEDTLEYIKKRLEEDEDWKDVTSLTRKEIMELTKICVQGNYFTWENCLDYLTVLQWELQFLQL